MKDAPAAALAHTVFRETRVRHAARPNKADPIADASEPVPRAVGAFDGFVAQSTAMLSSLLRVVQLCAFGVAAHVESTILAEVDFAKFDRVHYDFSFHVCVLVCLRWLIISE